MEFNFLKLIFTLEMEEDIADSHLLFAIRTDFAAIFRNAVGCERENCVKCSVATDCPYDQIFSQAISANSSAVKRFQKPPLPFVFDLPSLPPFPNREGSTEIGLTLVGLAVNHVRLFLEAVRFMFGHHDSRWTEVASVVKIESVDYLCNRTVISQNGSRAAFDRFLVLSLEGLEKSAFLSTDSVSLKIDTPLRIVKDGHALRELSFSALAMALIRRISTLAFYYCYMEMDLDYKSMSRQSQEICISNNGFRWTEWDNGISGIIGSGTFTGPIVEFHPFLLLGEFLHVGKGASYGLGRFRLEMAG
jgi:hypothetical protein